ncbi:GNAT family N-acetyltransferase [Cupriavidus sp. L7L]|uniref:GNAT family N-acetyltransferase n=1 Tax=Cupriavidus sp. L7L TaxID=2546443 RepID=UPI0010556AF7|nr:GNAT family N-acetyltransferase [Cupriavidus sp. L7L]TDF64622.1 GNAT family N-acetyltransferase [Cupriavidus sp. L7L]
MIRALQIRSATTADLPGITTVLGKCGLTQNASWSPDMFHIALMDGRIVACAGAERHAKVIVVCSVAVLPGYRDRGIAKHLVSAVLVRARAEGCERAVLATAKCPGFFSRYGFSLVATTSLPVRVRNSHTLTSPGMPAGVCMQCELK